ncbi:hypothetical protein ACWCQL_13855 [Streptomyces sp. NPDC002073]
MGDDTAQLLVYLFGPGKRDEHTDPHLVTAWDPDVPCPVRQPERLGLGELADLLDAPVEALRGARPDKHVWHVSVRNHADDRILTDAEWSEVAAAMVDAAGIAAYGDEQACRWIAVRHAPDHIHLVATLARVDGRQPRLRGDILAMHAVARQFEARWSLTPMSAQDRTAVRRPSTGELAKADRRGHFTGGALALDDAEFTGGTVTFYAAQFDGGNVTFDYAQFTDSTVTFHHGRFNGGTVSLGHARFSGGMVSFVRAQVNGGRVNFADAQLSGANVRWGRLRPPEDGAG